MNRGPTFYIRIRRGDGTYTYRCLQTLEDRLLMQLLELLPEEQLRRAEARRLARLIEERVA